MEKVRGRKVTFLYVAALLFTLVLIDAEDSKGIFLKKNETEVPSTSNTLGITYCKKKWCF